MRTLVFPGTFDPITNSHVDLARRARALFDHVIVAVGTRGKGEDPADVEARAVLCRLALAEYDDVEVDTFDSLLSEYVRSRGASFVLRGMRTVADFEYEFQRVDMTRRRAPEIEFVFLVPSENCAFVSSTLVREIDALGGDITGFVPAVVAEELARRREAR
ncbi:MAG TPA: pantetheine-phosphate adenylyltransferase [Pseudomonadales bacterium]|nr:pantetheine-phosphate adenylyltransferase [Pseudomonadales bacterium]